MLPNGNGDMNKKNKLQIFFKSELVQRYARTICELAKECWALGISDSSGFSISQVVPDTNIVIVDKSGTGFRRNKITENDLLLIDLASPPYTRHRCSVKLGARSAVS